MQILKKEGKVLFFKELLLGIETKRYLKAYNKHTTKLILHGEKTHSTNNRNKNLDNRLCL